MKTLPAEVVSRTAEPFELQEGVNHYDGRFFVVGNKGNAVGEFPLGFEQYSEGKRPVVVIMLSDWKECEDKLTVARKLYKLFSG